MQLKLSLFCSNIVVDKPNLSFGIRKCGKYGDENVYCSTMYSSLNYWLRPHPQKTIARLSTAYFFPRTTERVTWPDISRVCRLPAAVSTRGGHFSRLEGTRKREYLQPIFTVYFSILIACFYSYASFIILLLHELLVKLKEFQIQAENT